MVAFQAVGKVEPSRTNPANTGFKVDVCVVGACPAGSAVAKAALALGRRVAVIDIEPAPDLSLHRQLRAMNAIMFKGLPKLMAPRHLRIGDIDLLADRVVLTQLGPQDSTAQATAVLEDTDLQSAFFAETKPDDGANPPSAGTVDLPLMDNMGLASVGVQIDAGWQNPTFATSAKGVFALGKALQTSASAPLELYHAGIFVRSVLLGLPFTQRRDEIVPRIYGAPAMQLACCGLRETQVRAQEASLKIYRARLAPVPGFLKVMTNPSGTILGVGLVGAVAGERLGLWQLAVDRRLKVQDLAAVVLPDEAHNAALRQIVQQATVDRLRSPSVRLALTCLRHLGLA